MKPIRRRTSRPATGAWVHFGGLALLLLLMPNGNRIAFADHQSATATLTACCNGDCATASCSGSATVQLNWDNPDCFPDCVVTATLLAPDGSCSVDTNQSFRFVRTTGDTCTDSADPFSIPFDLDTPFALTHTDMCTIMQTNVLVEGPFIGNAQTVTLRGEVKKSSFRCVPAVSTWGMIAFVGLLLTVGTLVVRRRFAMSQPTV